MNRTHRSRAAERTRVEEESEGGGGDDLGSGGGGGVQRKGSAGDSTVVGARARWGIPPLCAVGGRGEEHSGVLKRRAVSTHVVDGAVTVVAVPLYAPRHGPRVSTHRAEFALDAPLRRLTRLLPSPALLIFHRTSTAICIAISPTPFLLVLSAFLLLLSPPCLRTWTPCPSSARPSSTWAAWTRTSPRKTLEAAFLPFGDLVQILIPKDAHHQSDLYSPLSSLSLLSTFSLLSLSPIVAHTALAFVAVCLPSRVRCT